MERRTKLRVKALVVRTLPLPPDSHEHRAELLDLGRVRQRARVKADLGEERQPCRAREHALYMALMIRAHLAAFPEEIGVLDEIGRVRGIGIPRPLEVAQR